MDTNGSSLGSQTLTNISNSSVTKVDFTGITDCYLVKVEMTASQSSPASINCGIEVNGKLLVDSSVPGGPGATDISKTVTSDASFVFTDATELANMVGPLTQVDENGDVKTPVTSEIASVGVVLTDYSGSNTPETWGTNVFTANPYTTYDEYVGKDLPGSKSATTGSGSTVTWTDPNGGIPCTKSLRICLLGNLSLIHI